MRSIGARMTIVFVGLIFSISVVFAFLDYFKQQRLLLDSIDDKLLTVVQTMKRGMPADYHDNIQSEISISPEEFYKIVDRNNKLCIELGLQYVWSVIKIGDNIHFTSSTSPDKNVDNGNHAKFFEVHADPDAFTPSFKVMTPHISEFHNEWGDGRMILAPHVDRHGRLYSFGASMSIEAVNDALTRSLILSLFIIVLVTLAGTVVCYLFANSIALPIRQLTGVAEHIAEGEDSKLEVGANLGSKEVHSLYSSIRSMYVQIQEKIAAISRNEESLRTILNSIGDGVIAVDTAYRITHMNPVAANLVGRSLTEAAGKPLTDIFRLIDKNTGDKVVDPVSLAMDEQLTVVHNNEVALTDADGTERSITYNAARILNPENRLDGVVIVFRDITNQLKMDEELLKSKKLEVLGGLAGGIAHDFNNILQVIFGNTELVRKGLDSNSNLLKWLDNTMQGLDRATHLTKQLLTFSKGGDPVLESIRLEKVVEETVRFNLSGSTVEPHFEFSDNLHQVAADREQLSRVIANLTMNAKKASKEGGNLYIKGENVSEAPGLKGDFVKLSIRDEGIGIDNENMEKIFDPFFGTTETGSGLGLAIAQSIVIKHKGRISVDSIANKGTTFTILLPALATAIKLDDPTILDTNSRDECMEYRILVMDDDTMVLELISEMLVSLGCEVVTVADGKTAIETYKDAKSSGKPFDLVILDLTIPGGMGGYEAYTELVKLDPQVKAIVCSGYSENSIVARFAEHGFKGRLSKPFLKQDLRAEIVSVLS